MGWMSAICDAHKKKVDVKLLYNWVHRKFNQFGNQTSWRQDAVEKTSTQQREPSGPRLISLEIRRVGDKKLEWEQVPGRAAQENGKEMGLWPIEWGSICCSSVRSPTPSHTQPFNKVRGIFFLRTVSIVFIVSSLWFRMHMCLYSWSWMWLYSTPHGNESRLKVFICWDGSLYHTQAPCTVFFLRPLQKLLDTTSFVDRFTLRIANLAYNSPAQCQKPTYVPKPLQNCTHVFVQDLAKTHIQQPSYRGFFKVLKRHPNIFEVEIKKIHRILPWIGWNLLLWMLHRLAWTLQGLLYHNHHQTL